MVNHTALAEIALLSKSDGQNMTEANNSTIWLSEMSSCDKNGVVENTAHNKLQTADGDFIWEKQQQGIVLGSFFWGYLITQLPGGLLAERYGGKRTLLCGMLLASICHLLCPLAASIHYVLLMLMRMGTGLGGGVVFPSGHVIWSKWAPPLERSILVALTYSGTQIGVVVALPLSGLLCDWLGWQYIFYLFGCLGLLWACGWWFYASDSPEQNKRITSSELRYIQKSHAKAHDSVETDQDKQIKRRTPWAHIFSSGAVWSISVAHTSVAFAAYLMMLTLPTYMKEVLNFDIRANGLLSAVPYIAFFIGIQIFAQFADWLRQRNFLCTKNVRKVQMTFGTLGQAIFLVLAGYCSCGQEYVAVTCITISQFMSGAQFSGFAVNHVDIAPNYAGTLFGISNTFATICGILAPSVASALTPDGTLDQWRIVFWVSFAISVSGWVFFSCFAQGEVQPWAIHEHDADATHESSVNGQNSRERQLLKN